MEKKINVQDIIAGKVKCRETSLEDAVCEAAFQVIRVCNSEYQQAIQQMYREFIELKRINKVDMKRILQNFADIELGEEVNPYLEDAEDDNE